MAEKDVKSEFQFTKFGHQYYAAITGILTRIFSDSFTKKRKKLKLKMKRLLVFSKLDYVESWMCIGLVSACSFATSVR